MAPDASTQAPATEERGTPAGAVKGASRPELPDDRKDFWDAIEAALSAIARRGGIAAIELSPRDRAEAPRDERQR